MRQSNLALCCDVLQRSAACVAAVPEFQKVPKAVAAGCAGVVSPSQDLIFLYHPTRSRSAPALSMLLCFVYIRSEA